jgi:hypothetical protein
VTDQQHVLERAVEIAPDCHSLQEVKRQLIREGYLRVNAHLSGWKIRRQLLLLIKSAP